MRHHSRQCCVRWLVFVVAAAFLTLSSAQGLAGNQPSAPGTNSSIHPGEDFFAFANGEWLRATDVPAGNARWTARHEIADATRRQVQDILAEAASAPRETLARQVGDFLAAYSDERAVEARGLSALRPLLRDIGGLRDKRALARLLGREMRADVDPLNWERFNSAHPLGLSVEPGNQAEKLHVAYLTQGGLGLAGREPYLSADAQSTSLRSRYLSYIAQMLGRAGFDRPAQRAAGVLAFEVALARTHATAEESANEANATNRWAQDRFAAMAPGVDWVAYFSAAGLSKQPEFVVWQPTAIRGFATLVAEQPLRSWQDYLRFRALDRYAEVLPKAFAAQHRSFHAAAGSSGTTPTAPRAQRAAEVTQEAMSSAIARLYVEKHFPAETKARVQTITAHVVAAFRKRVQDAAWLTPASRGHALDKLDRVYFGVGYPERWPDYSTLAVRADDAVGNLRRLERWTYRNALTRLGTPADLKEWWLAAHHPGGLLNFHQNAYNFSAALLQPPKFDASASDAAQYGSIGAIVGHELSHFVDTLGADHDSQGRKRRWWSQADLAGYHAATTPLIEQFAGYRPLEGAAIDGSRTLVENVADLAGLAAAFDAYRASLGAAPVGAEQLRQMDRDFFIAFARSWRAKYHDDGLRSYLGTDHHAPERFRVWTVRNIDAWYDAFEVRPGHALYLEPRARIRIW